MPQEEVVRVGQRTAPLIAGFDGHSDAVQQFAHCIQVAQCVYPVVGRSRHAKSEVVFIVGGVNDSPHPGVCRYGSGRCLGVAVVCGGCAGSGRPRAVDHVDVNRAHLHVVLRAVGQTGDGVLQSAGGPGVVFDGPVGVICFILAGLDMTHVVGRDAGCAGRSGPGHGKCGVAGSYRVDGRRGGSKLRAGLAQDQRQAEQGTSRRRQQSGRTEHPGHGIDDSEETLVFTGAIRYDDPGYSRATITSGWPLFPSWDWRFPPLPALPGRWRGPARETLVQSQ